MQYSWRIAASFLIVSGADCHFGLQKLTTRSEAWEWTGHRCKSIIIEILTYLCNSQLWSSICTSTCLRSLIQRRQIHQKQIWSMEFCCKPLVHYSPRASGNRGKFAWTAQVYDFGWCRVSGQSKYHGLAATGISGLSTDGTIIKIQDSK